MQQKIGDVGSISETFATGVAAVSAQLNLPATTFGLQIGVAVNGTLDAKILIAYLAAKIGGPIPAEVASFLEAALAV